MEIKENYLITGGAGFIGANFIHYLRKNDLANEIVVLDNLSNGDATRLDELETKLIVGDLQNIDDIKKSLKQIDHVVHLAASTSVIDSVGAPTRNFNVNVIGTYNLLFQANEKGAKSFVNASTGGALFGDAPCPISEKSVPRPISPYGSSKLAAEAYCSCFSSCYNIDAITLRFSNVYGKYSNKKDTVIPIFMNRILQNKPLIIFGDGKQTRDYVFVEDLCEAIYVAGKSHPMLSGNFFQLGSGIPTSILKLVELIKEVSGVCNLQLEFKDERIGEVKHNYADISLAKKVLSYEPKFLLNNGLQETWNYLKSRKHT